MPYVYAGKYLHIDLTHATVTVHAIDDADVRRFLLGSGYAARLFHAMFDPALAWDDPASPLLIFNGLLSGTFAPTGCRSAWCARSPLTGIWGESNMGGHWGAELRFAGLDGLVITGRAERPVYLWISGSGTAGTVGDRPELKGVTSAGTVGDRPELKGVTSAGTVGDRPELKGVTSAGTVGDRPELKGVTSAGTVGDRPERKSITRSGRSLTEPVTVELRDASHLWGRNHYHVYDQVRAETDPKAQVACIGMAGERLVRYAGVMQGGIEHARTAGRTGMGAVLGSKNLKAIVVRGQERPSYFDAKGFRDTVKASNARIKDGAYGLSMLGTAGSVPNSEKYGDLPLRNWLDGSWDKAPAISGQRIAETMFERHTFCFACPIGCGKTVRIDDGSYAGTQGHGPEYETLGGFGSLLLNADLASIAHINMLCNDYGIDTISTAASIAMAVEAHELGLLAPEAVDGLALTWGNAEAIVACVHKIARREGLGDLLADGTRAMAERLGPAAAPLAMHVKGLEMPYHDPRAMVSMAPGYATANRGACHMETMTYYEGYGIEIPGLVFRPGADHWQARLESQGGGLMAARYQNFQSVFNPLGLCKFIERGPIGPAEAAALVNQALGWAWTAEDLMQTGERIFNLKRLINAAYGITAADDVLPERLATHARPSGGAAGVLPDMALMMAEYYAARGWNPATGAPTAGRLATLGLV
ncbi:MAG: aldehyde ferredoxin oxidoreductase family protein [Anaerolinea sp.]|nr:aldehyde ferredoxin oxidoreductase family protein [Anaerolinea sp.]